MNTTLRRLVWTGLGLLALGTASARADLVPIYTGNGGTPGNFNYSLVFTTNTATPPVQQLSPYPSQDVLGHQMGGFATIFDFDFGTNNPLSSVVTPAGWIFTIQPTGINGYNTTPPDTALTNVTFYYNGTNAITTDNTFTGFQLRSSLTGINPFGNYSSNDAKYNTGAGVYTANGSTGSVTVSAPSNVPVPTVVVPEPASLVALSTGALAGLGLFLRRRDGSL